MRFRDRFTRGRSNDDAPPPAPPAVHRGPDAVPGASGRLTARRAFAIADAEAAALDSDRALTSMVSGEDVDGEGRSRSWEVAFLLRGRGSRLTARLDVDPEAEDLDSAPTRLRLDEQSLLRDIDPAFAASLARSLGLTMEEYEATRREVVFGDLPPPLPSTFRDSPEAMSDLVEQGLDVVSGPTDLTLGTGHDADGLPVWTVAERRRTWTTSFTPGGGGPSPAG